MKPTSSLLALAAAAAIAVPGIAWAATTGTHNLTNSVSQATADQMMDDIQVMDGQKPEASAPSDSKPAGDHDQMEKGDQNRPPRPEGEGCGGPGGKGGHRGKGGPGGERGHRGGPGSQDGQGSGEPGMGNDARGPRNGGRGPGQHGTSEGSRQGDRPEPPSGGRQRGPWGEAGGPDQQRGPGQGDRPEPPQGGPHRDRTSQERPERPAQGNSNDGAEVNGPAPTTSTDTPS